MYDHETVKNILETAIDSLIDNFLREPYMHRCEHSVHCELYNMLSVHRALQGIYPIKSKEFKAFKTTLIHKEWPETVPRPVESSKQTNKVKTERRGNFDLAILDPENIRQYEVESFIKGHIKPAFVVEMGLNYGLDHLKSDHGKLTNSNCSGGYLIHLWQPHKGIRKEDLDGLLKWIEEEPKQHNLAVVVLTQKTAYVKHLKDTSVEKIDNWNGAV